MGLDYAEAVTIIAGGATGYFAEFMPIFVFLAGILIAFGVMSMLIDAFFLRSRRDDEKETNIFDDNIIM